MGSEAVRLASYAWAMARRRALHDHYFKKAKAEGYAARSAYKLMQINDRRHIIKRGLAVLDLGCAPGSWLQVVCEKVGPTGRVVGLDLQPVSVDLPEWGAALVGDVFSTEAATLLAEAGSEYRDGFDVVLSDMAPGTTGNPGGDHFKSVELCRRVLALLPGLLRPGGSMAMKVFEGEEYPALLKECAAAFGFCKGYKPEATRDVSREMYLIGDHYQGRQPVPARATRGGTQPVAPPKPRPRAGWGDGGGGAA